MVSNREYNLELENFFSGFQTHYERHSKRYFGKLRTFFNDLSFNNKLFMLYKSQADKFLSKDFNIFDYLNTDENALSDYIGMILDPRGVHGQECLFLNIFIDFLQEGKKGFKEIERADYALDREYWADGRIDILLHYENTAIIIESKPYASDQENQLKRYYDYIKRRYEFVFVVYLSRGNDPSENSMPAQELKKLRDKRQFRTISFFEFSTNFLNKCYHQCESIKFKFFLYDFIYFLQTQFLMIEETINESI
jgi:hypothetical protein